ncbi:SDR family NAD(P)-dependent oxidoreductase, partial [Bradyrhizobium nitroreducens]|uniref:SDR family NAD(P)-dependent oxidoreductase n=1 Tax=Bradyrhizobium nitroreducens TaxID=709803 RepID=UPI001FE234DD
MLHPGLLDGALQTSIGLMLGRTEARMAMPFALEQLEVLAAIPDRAWAVVRYSADSGAASAVQKLDIDVCDASGQVCASLRGFSSRVVEGVPGWAKASGELPGEEVAEPIGELTLVPVWQAVASGDAAVWPQRDQRVVVIGDGAQLWQALEGYGQVQMLALSANDGIERIAERLEAMGQIDHVLWAVPAAAHELTSEDLIDAQQDGVFSGFRLIKALLSLGYGKQRLGLTVLTQQSQSIDEADPVWPAHAGVHGLVGSLAKECSQWKVRLLDLAHDGPWPEGLLAQPAQAQGDALVYREGRWYRPQLLNMRLPQPGGPVYRDGGLYVLIGGAGGIGEVFSEHLIRQHQARVVWIGRRARDEAIVRKQQRLAQLGPEPCYIAADASDREALQVAAEEIRQRFGKIDGVVLATIVLRDQSLAQMDEATFAASLQAKVDVNVRVAQVFGTQPLDFVLSFSSMQSTLKAPGQSNYAAGCVFADAFGQAWARQGVPVKTINWGYWGSVGVVASAEYRKRMEQMGIASIEPPEAMAVLDRLLSAPVQQAAFLKTSRAGVAKASGVVDNETLQVLEVQGATERVSLEILEASAPRMLPVEVSRRAQDQAQELERLLGRLLWGQLSELGLFATPAMDVAAWKQAIGLPAMYERWLDHSVQVLHEQGYLERDGQAWKVREVAAAEPMAQLWTQWEGYQERSRSDASGRAQLSLLDHTLRALAAILQGQRKATEVLFPNASMQLVEGIYKGNPVSDYFNEVLGDSLLAYVEQRLKQQPEAKLRLIEIGAGTGGTSARLLQRLQPYAGSIAEYRYTDISKAFLLHAEQHYGPQASYLKTGLFNVEQPLSGQGVEPGSYDVAIATNVLHATRDMRQTVRNAKALLKAQGLLLVNEITGNNLFTHLTFGLLQGWWLYEDAALRVAGSPALAPATWHSLLEGEGFAPAADPARSAHALGQQILVATSNGIVR